MSDQDAMFAEVSSELSNMIDNQLFGHVNNLSLNVLNQTWSKNTELSKEIYKEASKLSDAALAIIGENLMHALPASMGIARLGVALKLQAGDNMKHLDGLFFVAFATGIMKALELTGATLDQLPQTQVQQPVAPVAQPEDPASNNTNGSHDGLTRKLGEAMTGAGFKNPEELMASLGLK